MNIPEPFLSPLFDHMSHAHGLTLTESELEDIRMVCRKLDHQEPIMRVAEEVAALTKSEKQSV